MSDLKKQEELLHEPAEPNPVAGEGPEDWELFEEREGFWHYWATDPRNGERQKFGPFCKDDAQYYMDRTRASFQRITPEGTPKLEEIARKLLTENPVTGQWIRASSKEYLVQSLRPFITPACSPPQSVIDAATELLDAMETCHVCKGVLVLQEHPVHCEDCSGDCENHEGSECTPIYVLHAKLRKALKLATPASTGEANGWVSVEDGLPKKSGQYWIITANGRQGVGIFSKGSGRWPTLYYPNPDYSCSDVTHWQPLPPAPTSVPQAEPPKCACNGIQVIHHKAPGAPCTAEGCPCALNGGKFNGN
ncbi:MAG TPA: DUF551 domain-containing protein [Candidatus Angelobacter sp.]|jgi:hypothetical protein|nr:DUF551 domain-containing protein [Candidatus Angelobacter sp.]